MCVARVKELPVIAEFVSFQDIVMFQKKGESRLEKVQKPKINVRVVLDMEWEIYKSILKKIVSI